MQNRFIKHRPNHIIVYCLSEQTLCLWKRHINRDRTNANRPKGSQRARSFFVKLWSFDTVIRNSHKANEIRVKGW